ncbi:Nedd8-conjugating enzyme UbcE2M [Bulinus truncatus]|nr:Nedd8-conjugating enzyme UbcE2M [Bulinus truncatus]
MIKLFSLKQQNKGGENAPDRGKRASAAQLRVQKDINELNLPRTCQVEFPDPDDLLNFKVIISPDEEFYRGGRFVFSFKVGQGYPHDPPKVKCETMVYHPNIDLEGNVCLNILREDWKPVLTINSIVYGLQYLFLEPNPEDPLNKEAAEVLQTNRRLFEQNVAKSMRGGHIGNKMSDKILYLVGTVHICDNLPLVVVDQQSNVFSNSIISCALWTVFSSPNTAPVT